MQPTLLLLGGTGRTGGRAFAELLARGLAVRAIVRDAGKLPAAVREHPAATVHEASLLSLDHDALRREVAGCTAVVSCLGHVIDLKGVFGPPRDLVTRAVQRVFRALEAERPARPVRLVLMSSVSVHHPRPRDPRRGGGERAILAAIRALVPPARDNQTAADFLRLAVGATHPAVGWVVVRPDTLGDGDVSPYVIHPELVHGLFRPGTTRRANVAHFMGELVTSDETWARWQGEMPVIVDG